MHRILLIDDDELLAPPLAAYLQRFDLQLDSATRPSEGLARLRAGGYDAAILDVMLPEMDGFELCRTIRKRSSLPILMLTARGEVMDRIVGLELGADDYLAKPFDLDELVARVRALLRRRAGAASSEMTVGELTLDPVHRRVTLRGDDVRLTAKEFALLETLMRRPGAVLSRERLEESIYGWGEEIGSNAVEVHLHNLRRKLGTDVVRNVRGVGYRIAG